MMSNNGAEEGEAEAEPEEAAGPTWFTSLEEFRPLQYRYYSGAFMESYFACTVKTGEHYVLKRYFKGGYKSHTCIPCSSRRHSGR
jgi:hypothetical protein